MRIAIESLLIVMAGFMLIPVGVLAIQALVAFPRASRPAPMVGRRPRIAVLVPAHDESTGIRLTLRSVLAQLQPRDRCLVVADNCTDDTAAIARAEGVEVAERRDDRRGKGYALDFGLGVLAQEPPEVLIVVDADCLLADDCIARIGQLSLEKQRPVQALYLMRAPAGTSSDRSIAEFAWRVRNWARPLAFLRLNLPCQLMGSGMAFPWRSLRRIDLASGHLVEDVKMGLDLARAGYPPLFCPDALVTSTFPVNEAGRSSQRTRWEHGHLGLIAATVPATLVGAIITMDIGRIAMALDIAVPPLALMVLGVGVVLPVTAVVASMGWSPIPFLLALVAGLLLALSLALFWIRFGSRAFSFGGAVVYALRKIPFYLAFLSRRQTDWVKSRRDGE